MPVVDLQGATDSSMVRAQSAETFEVCGMIDYDNALHPHRIIDFKNNPDCCFDGEKLGTHFHLHPESYLPSVGLTGTTPIFIGEVWLINGATYLLTERKDSEGEIIGDPILLPA